MTRLFLVYLGVAGYLIAALLAVMYYRQDRILYQEIRQSREQFHTILQLRREVRANDEAARECEAKMALVPNQ